MVIPVMITAYTEAWIAQPRRPDPTRVKLLWALMQGESSVSCLAELAGATPTSVSQHLAKLRLAGLVRGRREGTFIFYTAGNTHVQALLAEALSHAEPADSDLGSEGSHRHVLGAATASSVGDGSPVR